MSRLRLVAIFSAAMGVATEISGGNPEGWLVLACFILLIDWLFT